MTKLLRGGLFVSLLAITFFAFGEPRQAKEQQPQDRFARLDAMRVHYQNYGKRHGSRVSEKNKLIKN